MCKKIKNKKIIVLLTLIFDSIANPKKNIHNLCDSYVIKMAISKPHAIIQFF